MPKFYCEYCDIYLTHSSAGGRRQHNSGRKHINNKIEYYQTLIREKNLAPPMYPVPPHLSSAIRPHMMPRPMGMPGMLPGQMPLPGMLPGMMPLPGGLPGGGPGTLGKAGMPGGPPGMQQGPPGMRPIMKMPIRPQAPGNGGQPNGGPPPLKPLANVKEEQQDDNGKGGMFMPKQMPMKGQQQQGGFEMKGKASFGKPPGMMMKGGAPDTNNMGGFKGGKDGGKSNGGQFSPLQKGKDFGGHGGGGKDFGGNGGMGKDSGGNGGMGKMDFGKGSGKGFSKDGGMKGYAK